MAVSSLPSAHRSRMLARLQAHGLPVAYGGPGVVGTNCPLCPPKLGPFGTRYIAASMALRFASNGAMAYECENCCPPRDVAEALKAPGRRRAAA